MNTEPMKPVRSISAVRSDRKQTTGYRRLQVPDGAAAMTQQLRKLYLEYPELAPDMEALLQGVSDLLGDFPQEHRSQVLGQVIEYMGRIQDPEPVAS